MAEIRMDHDLAQEQLDGLGDIPQGVEIPKDFIGADGNFEAPSVEDVLKALEGMQGISLEDRDALKAQLLQQKMRGQFAAGGGDDMMAENWQDMSAGSFLSQGFILLGFLLVIALIFVFFGLKLYRSLTEKERKREEKKKLKMVKKKK